MDTDGNVRGTDGTILTNPSDAEISRTRTKVIQAEAKKSRVTRAGHVVGAILLKQLNDNILQFKEDLKNLEFKRDIYTLNSINGGRRKKKRKSKRRRKSRRKRKRRRKSKRKSRRRRKRKRKRRGGYRLRFPDSDTPTWELTDLPEYNKLNINEKTYTFGEGDFHDMVAYLNQYGITSPATQQYIMNNLIPLGLTRLEFLPWLELPTDMNNHFSELEEEDKSNFINALYDTHELSPLEEPA